MEDKYISQDELDKLHEKLLKITKEVIEICDKEKIKYYMIGGTLLGAVRHDGFIPWDDDIDLAMIRRDYEKFLKIIEEKLPDNLKLLHYKNNKSIQNHFLKIIDKDNYVIEEVGENKLVENNIFIDIFPLDSIPDNKLQRIMFEMRAKLKLFKVRLAKLNNKKDFESNNKAKKFLFNINKFLGLSRLLNQYNVIVEFDKYICKYSNMTTKNISNVLGGNGIFKETFNREQFIEDKIFDFDGLKLNGSKNYDLILRKMYGNYLELPPVEKRVCKHLVEIKEKK